ncbi:MAG TPA: DUF6065 family protein [Bradyrhizobium sp.]|nr:DUF6065 family protein [Bradyrhizobium sp.]
MSERPVGPIDLTCFLHPGWQPLIRPAPAQRDWMDATPESFAYRCLPLNIANAHGWELLNPCAFDACWNGGSDTAAVTIKPHAAGNVANAATSLFGQGILTFHVPGIFRTPPGWNLWIGGSPNQPKDGIAPLTGVVETDWSPFTFTMNWRFTRPHHWVRFDAGEPVCFFFPLQRALLDDVRPALAPIDAEPGLAERFQEWSNRRDAFVLRMVSEPPSAPAGKWQKHYYRGVDMSEKPQVADHRTRLRLQPFDASAIPWPLRSADDAVAAAPPPANSDPPTQPASQTLLDLRKREWLLEALERQRALAEQGAPIERRAGLGSDEFLDRYYAANRPVILTGEMSGWPALAKWTPEYLKRTVGATMVDFQADLSNRERFEIHGHARGREMPFDRFIDLASRPGPGNDASLTAQNSARNADAMAMLHPDLGFPEKFLSRADAQPDGSIWIGSAGTLTSLHHGLTNNLIAQLVGRNRFLVLPASEVGKLYNHAGVFSEISDLEDPAVTLTRFPRLEHARFTEVTLMPGEMIFMPLAWWYQVRAIDFSVAVTYTNFRWPNDGYRDFPAG